MSLLAFEQVSRTYPNGAGSQRTILNAIDLTLAPGEVVALIGPSGAGKTTLLYLAAGLCLPSIGRVLFEGRDLAAMSAADLARIRRDRIGLVFQNSLCLSALPVWENAALPLLLGGAPLSAAKKAAIALLEKVELAPLADAPTSVLSGGQRQRLGLARAMAVHPTLLLADEPTADLDIHTAERIERTLFDWLKAENCAALIVTHSATIEKAVPRVYRLDEGRLNSSTN